MPTPYRAEVFDRSFNFKSFSPISDPSISFDYLTLEPTKIVCPSLTADKGDFIIISGGEASYQGIVDDIQRGNGTTVSIRPLLSIFDCDVYFDRTQSHSLEAFLAGIITANWGSNSDTLQNITGLTVTTSTTTTGYLNLKDNIHNLYEIITKCLTGYGVVVNFSINPKAQTASVVIGVESNTAIIEADLPNVAKKVLTIGDSYGAPNKITIYNADVETQSQTYYLHQNGTVGASQVGRITPVFAMAEFVTVDDGSTFTDTAKDAAYAALKPQQYDNHIEITVPNDIRTISVSMPIGTVATIYADGATYTSILTGYTRTGKATTLLFGSVRVDLTKKLILERRRSS